MSDETLKLMIAARDLSGYADHDMGCNATFNAPCDCGYSGASRRLLDALEALEHSEVAAQVKALTGRTTTVVEMDIGPDGDLTPTKGEGA